MRGLRICQDERCSAPHNRDRTAACNIGLQFRRLFAGEGALRALSDEEREFQRLQAACAACG